MFTLNELIENLEVEQLDTLLFRGTTLPHPLSHVFGGQVLAQALNAGARTVDIERRAHSLHAYFLRSGDVNHPIIYDVDPIRDGGSFSTRRVVAKQRGKAIFNCSISFQKIEAGFSHQMEMPAGTPEPETLESQTQVYARYAAESAIAGKPFAIPSEVVDIRSVYESNPFKPKTAEPVQGLWFKLHNKLGANPVIHQTLLAYISDMGLMTTGMLPHGASLMDGTIQGASLDHSMWFHSELNLDDWHYYHMDSPRAEHSRNFNRGSIYTREGVLVASTAQEGLVRVKR